VDLLRHLANSRIVLAANVVDGYPSEFEYTRDFLLVNGIRHLTTISHPLQKRSKSKSRIVRYQDGKVTTDFSLIRPNSPPYTHVLDLATGFIPLKADIWIGFNPMMTAMGSLCPRVKVLANWAIDFVPNRGEIGLAEKLYRGLESFMMGQIDAQIENSLPALEARVSTTGKVPNCQLIAPIGVWQDSFCSPQITRHGGRRVVYFGSMDVRNGIPFLAELLDLLVTNDPNLFIDVIGEGQSSDLMRNLAHRFPDQIIFHGYIEKQDDINAILRRAVVALAPYDELPGSFTEFADPQKLKYYAANGVPTILTNVAPAAREMERCGAAVLLAQSAGPEKWASVLNNWLNNSSEWYVAAKSSYEYALNFERNHVYSKTFKTLFSLLDSESTRK